MGAGKVLADVMEPHGLVTADNRKIGRMTGLMWMPLCHVDTWRSTCPQISCPHHVVYTGLKESDLVSEEATHMAPPHISQSVLTAWSVLYGVIWQIPQDTESIKRTRDPTRLLFDEAIAVLTKWLCPLSSPGAQLHPTLNLHAYEYAYFGSKSVTHLRPDLH